VKALTEQGKVNAGKVSGGVSVSVSIRSERIWRLRRCHGFTGFTVSRPRFWAQRRARILLLAAMLA
jgi:hypothetical protein